MCFRKAVLTVSSSQVEKESEGRLETGRPLIRKRRQWLKWDRGSGDEGEEEDVTGVELMGQLDRLGRKGKEGVKDTICPGSYLDKRADASSMNRERAHT